MQKTYTVSLSRWHTIANRLKSHAEVLCERAQAVLAHTTAQHELSNAQREALSERGQQALADIAQARAALQAATTVRASLAQANAEQGVSAKLAQAEGLRREIQMLDSLGNVDLLARVSLDDANTALNKRVSEGGVLSGRAAAVPLALVPLNALDGHARDKALLERQQQELMDEVNTLNRNNLSIDLPQEIAILAGL